jgi:torulene dioxygenase
MADQNRYVWSVVNRGYSNFLNRISRFDFKAEEVRYWDNPQDHAPGEAIFVLNRDGIDEYDRVLLSVVLDGFKDTSYLACWTTMKELGRTG